jgi:hypothetical protein|tara:strand:- start:2065 stop:2286 length:222 start_codon:yes stop_codon:yes gene_type:complete
MKFVLIIWVCTFLEGKACLTPQQYPLIYDSWYECNRDALKKSSILLSKMGYKYVNDNKIGIKYHCKTIETRSS